MGINPITCLDYPDPDVIRVKDTYYMVSTTMHFFPGCVILRSYDLVHWEIAAYVYDRLDDTPGQRLEGEENIYGKGMWAASLRWHKGIFYVCFVANDTHKTYLYTAKEVEGVWTKHEIEGFYHDCSLFFEEDDSVYIIYGNTEIHLTQLRTDLSGPLPGGLDRVIVSDAGNGRLGYEGSHFYKINGVYYLFLIHSRRDRWMRTEACYCADSLEGEFVGGDVLEDDLGYCGQGAAQGGIVDTPEGKWYAMVFQDRGAVGRIPILVPMHFEKKLLQNGRELPYPVLGEGGRVPESFETVSTRPEYVCRALYGSDDFAYEPEEDGKIHLKDFWQFNHTPDAALWGISQNSFWIRTDKLCRELTQAKNTLTQRLIYPGCRICVELDFSGLQEGDCAGLCALQGCYGMVGVEVREQKKWLVMGEKAGSRARGTEEEFQICERLCVTGERVRLMLEADFEEMKDVVRFYYDCGEGFRRVGAEHKLYFKLDHFCGCRAGLFCYSTEKSGGVARFSGFTYD